MIPTVLTFCIGGVPILGGLAGLWGAISWYVKNRKLQQTAQRTKGTVVRLEENRSKGSRSYSPVFEFKTPDGRSFRVLDKTGTNPSRYEVGESVDVKYSSDNPENALIDDEMNSNPNSAPIGLGCFSVFMLIFGIVIMLKFLSEAGIMF